MNCPVCKREMTEQDEHAFEPDSSGTPMEFRVFTCGTGYDWHARSFIPVKAPLASHAAKREAL